jgi:DNA-binding GntR family transcriptional regulator
VTDKDDVEFAGGPGYVRICDHLRADILNQRFDIGARLKIVALAKAYNVSQMPVREALQQLQGEGLVRIVPNRGAIVRAVDEKFIRNIYDIREILEAFFTRRAAVTASRRDIDELNIIQSAYERYTDAEDINMRIKLNLQLHARIYRLAGNEDALEIIDKHAIIVRVLIRRYNHSPGRIRQISDQHRAIIAAIATGDVDLAGDLAAKHMRDARDELLERMQHNPIPKTGFNSSSPNEASVGAGMSKARVD